MLTFYSDDENFLFIHQTPHQQRLLVTYGNYLSLLDATYKTCKYDLPVFHICVCTNSGYSVVATLILENEKAMAIEEAMRIVKDWNPDWNPRYFLTDFDSQEIKAIENIFPGNQHLVHM